MSDLKYKSTKNIGFTIYKKEYIKYKINLSDSLWNNLLFELPTKILFKD